MMNAINDRLTIAYLKFTGFIKNLREDERGLSGVVVAVLLILVAVLAIAAIWGALSGQLEIWWQGITNNSTFTGPNIQKPT